MKDYNTRRAARLRVQINYFADALADGLTVAAASKRLGVTANTGRVYLRAICDGLGPQAS